MPTRNFTEFGINMNLTHMMMYQQPYFEEKFFNEYFSDEHPCHLYFVGRRPKIKFDVDKFFASKEMLTFPFIIQYQDTKVDCFISAGNSYETEDVKLICEYPYTEFKILVNGEQQLEGLASILFQQMSRFQEGASKHLDFEVLYIGQAYGDDGSRQAPDRLKSHSTLQGIYSEAMINNPDSDIFIALASFEEIIITSFDGTKRMTAEDYDTDEERFRDVSDKLINNKISSHQKINFTEAALINYFKPRYNQIYKNTFPNPAHKTYSECYDLDINSVMIELQTQNYVNCNFYTELCPQKNIHIGKFLLHSAEDRKSLFEFSFEYNESKIKE